MSGLIRSTHSVLLLIHIFTDEHIVFLSVCCHLSYPSPPECLACFPCFSTYHPSHLSLGSNLLLVQKAVCRLGKKNTMSTTGSSTFRNQNHRSSGRSRAPDFDNASVISASQIPRPHSTATPAASSDIGSTSMSAASSRQRQNQSKRDEVCGDKSPGCRSKQEGPKCLYFKNLYFVLHMLIMIISHMIRRFDAGWRPT